MARLRESVSMPDIQIRYDDGAAYERMMGTWSRAAGEIFLDWLAPARGLRWIDVGCGTGAFTELVAETCSPAEVEGVDPSEAQLSFARARHLDQIAKFQQGDALALPSADERFDVAVMALVIFFVPDPAKGVDEMVRVVRPGGTVAAYVWDMTSSGHPLELMHGEMGAIGFTAPRPPRSDITSLESLRQLWRDAQLDEIDTQHVTVRRTFADFEDYWTTSTLAATVSQTLAAMDSTKLELLKSRMRAQLLADATGRIICSAHVNAIRGRRPQRLSREVRPMPASLAKSDIRRRNQDVR
jgi:ubiquinone/menaquinone biosynthesis C-methylase UbiE